MGDQRLGLGTSTAITITLNNLASHASNGRESTAIDNSTNLNSTNLYFDADVTVTAALVAGSPANDKAIYVYVYESEDGTNYTDNATGSDAAITLRSPTNLRLIGVLSCPDSGGLTYRGTFAVRDLKRKWGIVVRNYTGLAFAASGCSASYSGRYATAA